MRKTSTANVTVNGVEFDVTYTFYPGFRGTQWEPPEYANVELYKVEVGGEDLIEVIRESILEEIQSELVSHHLEESRECYTD